jgi:hypothetical protein
LSIGVAFLPISSQSCVISVNREVKQSAQSKAISSGRQIVAAGHRRRFPGHRASASYAESRRTASHPNQVILTQ